MAWSLRRLGAVIFAAACGALLGSVPGPAAGADNTWATALMPASPGGPLLALAISPADGRELLAGTRSGVIYRSSDGGSSWSQVKRGLGRGVATLAFDPGRSGVAWAGTWGAGLWRSADGGMNWQPAAGTEGHTIRALAFMSGTTLAGGDQGVLASQDGMTWGPSGLAQVQVSAVAIVQDGPGTSLVVAGGDGSRGGEPLPLFSSADTGQSWSPVAGAAGAVGASTMVSALATTPGSGPRTLVMGTNAGLFQSPDQGASWQQLTGSGVLPATDFSALAFPPLNPGRLYVASDGGASDRGGLWVTTDAGAHFTSLTPPEASVTAVAVSGGSVPTLLVATYRLADRAVVIWTYRDAGGQPASALVTPQATAPIVPAPAAAAPAHAPTPLGSGQGLAGTLLMTAANASGIVTSPEAPFAAIGVLAAVAVLAALVAHVRRRPPG